MRFAAALPIALAAALSAMPASAALAPGDAAPDFTADGAIAGKPVRVHLKALLGRGPVVLYFFPAAFTGGCNAEAHAFAEAIGEFRKAGATVLGMSADGVEDLKRFSASKCAGKFAVASAPAALIARYKAALSQPVKGRSVSSRISYVIARDGKVAFVHDDPAPAGHITQTLAAVRRLKG